MLASPYPAVSDLLANDPTQLPPVLLALAVVGALALIWPFLGGLSLLLYLPAARIDEKPQSAPRCGVLRLMQVH